MPKIDFDAFQALGEMLRPPPPPAPVKNEDWEPSLNPTQRELYDAQEQYILCWSEKGPGKTWGVLHKMVNHLYRNQNALAIIGVRVRSMANKGGAWDKLIGHILPEWEEGQGLHYSQVLKDSQHNEFVWVQNRYGSWSMVVLISAPHSSQLKDRMPGYEPSFVFWDELTKCDSEEYFKAPAIQLGRRPYVDDVQQYVGACNPTDPDHWVHKKWFEDNFDEETGVWDQAFREIYFPKEENIKNLVAGYYEGLAKIYRKDPTGRQQMIEGEWVARPSGNSLFGEIYLPLKHCAPLNDDGNPDMGHRLCPETKHPMVLGLDPGSVNNAFMFLQWLPLAGKMKWMPFDEIVTIKKRINYYDFVPIVMRRIRWWRDLTGAEIPQVWISDNSAFNQYRAASGSYDVLDIEKIYEANRAKYRLEPIKIKQCPKFNGSVIASVRQTQEALSDDRVLVSSGCPLTHKMFLHLQGHPTKEGEAPDPEKMMTPVRSDHIHVFSAWAYPTLMASLNPTALLPSDGKAMELI